MRDCPTVSAQSVRRILGIEVGDLLVVDGAQSGSQYSVLIRCAASFAGIEVARQSDGATLEHVVNLDDFPGDAAPRALALAGLELLASMNVAVRDRIENGKQAAVAVTAQTETPAPAVSAGGARIGAAGLWRTFLVDQGAGMWGGRIDAATTFGRWSAAIDADAAGARNTVSLGRTSAFAFSSAVSLGLQFRSGRIAGETAVGARAGLVRLSGNASARANITESAATHPWGGPLVTARASLVLRRFSLDLAAEAGRSIVRSDGLVGGATAISVGGTWAAVTLGGGFHP